MAKFMPKTSIGKKALYYGLGAVIWGTSIIFQEIIRLPGMLVLGIEVILVIQALINSFKALIKEKDYSNLGWVVFGMLCLVGGFWLYFIIGEIIYPH